MKLILVRGLPGSGKSTYAKTLSYCVHEADQFFMEGNEYKFNPSKLAEAHLSCQRWTNSFLMIASYAKEDTAPIVVANTFTQKWEMEKYFFLASLYNIEVEVHTCTGDFGNVHGVPAEAIERMKARWEGFDGELFV